MCIIFLNRSRITYYIVIYIILYWIIEYVILYWMNNLAYHKLFKLRSVDVKILTPWSSNIMWYNLSVTCDRSVVISVTPVSSTNKTTRHDITEILLKVSLKTINQPTNLHQIVDTIYILSGNCCLVVNTDGSFSIKYNDR